MSRKSYVIFNIATGLLKGAVLAAIVIWLLPLWGINVPIWGLTLIVVAFLIYEIVTFRLGRRALERKPAIWSEAIVGCCGKATQHSESGVLDWRVTLRRYEVGTIVMPTSYRSA